MSRGGVKSLRHRPKHSGDHREGGASASPGLGLASACGGTPRARLSVTMYLGWYLRHRSYDCQCVPYFYVCGTQSRWPHLLANVSGGFRVPTVLTRPRPGICSATPPRHQHFWSDRHLGRSHTVPLSLYEPESHICACGVLPRRQGQQFVRHPCPGDFRQGRHSSSRPGRPQALFLPPRESGSQTAPLNNRHHCSGGECSPKRWDKHCSKATLTLSISHRVSLFQVPCQHVRDQQQQPATPGTLEKQNQEERPTTEGLLTLAECHGRKRNRRCGAAAAPQLQLAARAPTARARSPAWRRPNHGHVPSLGPRSRSLSKLHPAAAPARIPVIWSARPARKRTPEGSSTRLQLPRRWGGTRRITPRCRSLIFACLFFSFVLLQIGTPSGHLSTHLLCASLRSEPRSAAPVSAVRCWCGQPGAARATLCCFTKARLGHDPQVGALQGFVCQLLACAVPLRLLLGLWSYGGCTLCIQAPLLLSEHMLTSPMQLQTYLPGWLDCFIMVCRSLCCHFRLLVSRCALQVATKSGKGRHTRRFCLLLCLCLSLVGLVPGMSSSHPGAFWRAPARPRHQQYDCMSLRPARKWLFDPTPHSLVLAEGAVAFGPNTVFQRFLFFGESGAMGHSRRSQATKIRSANRPGKRERACIQTTIKLTASAKCAARKPLDRRFDAPTFPPPPPPPPPRRDRVGHVAPQADMLASRDRNLAHSTPSTSSGTEPHPISPEAQLEALRGRLHRKLIESCRGMTDFMPTFVTTKPLPCTGSGPNTILYSCSSEALFSKDIAHHPCTETKSPGELFNRSITGAYMVALCYFLCLASGLCLCLGFPSHAKHQVREAPAEKHRASTFCCSLGKAPPIDAECRTGLHCAQQCFCSSLADDPSGSTFSLGRGLGWDWISLATLQGWLLSPTFKLVELYQLLLARPKVRTHIPARGLRSKFRSYASLCLFATYLAGCCHMGLALGLQSHPYLEARRSIPTRMPGLDRTRPMHQRLRSAWRALSAPTLAAQRLLFTMIFDRSCRCHWGTTLAVAVMLLTWLEVRPRPYHTGTVNQVTDLALVEVLFDGSLWVPLSAISGVLLTALCFRQLCTMPGPKSGGGRGYSFRCLKWLLLLLVVSSQTASVSGVKVDASVAQQASRVFNGHETWVIFR